MGPCQVRSEMQKKELWQNLFIDLFSKRPSLQRLLIWHNWSLSPSLYCWFNDWYELHFDDWLCVNEFFTKNPVSISWSDTHLVFSHTKIILCQPGAGLRSRLNIILMTGTTNFFVQHHLGPRPSPHFGHQQSWMKNNYSFYKVKDNHISKFNSFFKSLLHTIYSIQPPVKLVK